MGVEDLHTHEAGSEVWGVGESCQEDDVIPGDRKSSRVHDIVAREAPRWLRLSGKIESRVIECWNVGMVEWWKQ